MDPIVAHQLSLLLLRAGTIVLLAWIVVGLAIGIAILLEKLSTMTLRRDTMAEVVSFALAKVENERKKHAAPVAHTTMPSEFEDVRLETLAEASATVYVESWDGSQVLAFPEGGGNVLCPGPADRAEVLMALRAAIAYLEMPE